MTYITELPQAIASSNSCCDRSYIHADELTEGDIIRHFTGDTWMVISEPEYTNRGIEFNALWLDIDSPDNVQTVCFAPQWRFELVTHQPSRNEAQIAA